MICMICNTYIHTPVSVRTPVSGKYIHTPVSGKISKVFKIHKTFQVSQNSPRNGFTHNKIYRNLSTAIKR